ncbi:hypothetical protein ACFSRY_15125 [Pontibacter locisalis]|uniref:DUF4177 domain-containing protein n=1 Tax=Pontibacter locisalis TaxID=1719035 RepID=A0ABW5INI1_9BACT
MKKAILLISIAFGLGLSAQAQEQTASQELLQPSSGEVYEYITVYVAHKQRIKGWNAWVRDNRNPYAEAVPINDETNELQKFSSPYDVINYLGSLGWEFAAFTPSLNGQFSWQDFMMKRKKVKA